MAVGERHQDRAVGRRVVLRVRAHVAARSCGGPSTSVRGRLQCLPSAVDVKYGYQHGPRMNRYSRLPDTTGFG